MRLHKSHDDGGFGVSNNTITRLGASYTTNARFVAPLSRSGCRATTSKTALGIGNLVVDVLLLQDVLVHEGNLPVEVLEPSGLAEAEE
jgi:hypothetical protein